MTINLNLLATLALATALFFVGQLIVARSALLQRYSIPVPVVGGFLFAVALALAGLVTPVQFTMNESLKDPLLLAFFATLGLGADVRSLARGGRKLAILLVLFVLLMMIQNAIGITMARLLDLHPLVGLLAGSISLTGGHGTAAAYATSFSATRNLQGAMELGMAAATAGLILGSLLSGPVAERLMKRARARASSASGQAATPETAPENPFHHADYDRAAAVRVARLPRLHRGRPPRARTDEGHRHPAAGFPVGAAGRHGRAQPRARCSRSRASTTVPRRRSAACHSRCS